MTHKNKYVKVILAALVALTSLAGRAEDGKVRRTARMAFAVEHRTSHHQRQDDEKRETQTLETAAEYSLANHIQKGRLRADDDPASNEKEKEKNDEI